MKRTSARLQEKATKSSSSPPQGDSHTASYHPYKAAQRRSKPTADPNVDIETFHALYNSVQAAQWQSYLSNAPKRLSPTELQTFLRLLKKLDVRVDQTRAAVAGSVKQACEAGDVDVERHCVRCHETYKEKDNKYGSCLIEHNELEPEHEIGSDYEYRASCDTCGKEMFDDDVPDDFDTCYRGRHTIQPSEVKYDDEHTYTCGANGCASAT